MIKSLHLQNFLSFGPEAKPVELGALNIIIGTNGSGKSNFIEGIELLRHLPKDDIQDYFRRLGGKEIFWRENENERFAKFSLNAIIKESKYGATIYEIDSNHFNFAETVSNLNDEAKVETMGHLVITYDTGTESKRALDHSIIGQIKGFLVDQNLQTLQDFLPNIRTFRDWTFGKNSPLRQSQRADMPNKWLDADGSNLGLILNVIRKNPDAKAQFLEGLKTLNPNFTDFDVQIEGSSVQVFLTENRKITPALRLSDGTLRYLCLLALLCHPNPPPLVCIEEPEMGLHPDVFHGLAALMREASKRMQLVVTTHSDIFVDCFTDTPEVIKVCDKIDGSTQIRSLALEELKPWLADYSLGNLWLKGHLGGNLY